MTWGTRILWLQLSSPDPPAFLPLTLDPSHDGFWVPHTYPAVSYHRDLLLLEVLPFPSPISLCHSCLFLDFSSKVLFSRRTSLTSCLHQIPSYVVPWPFSYFWLYVDLWTYCVVATSHRYPVEPYKTKSPACGWESNPGPSPSTVPSPKQLFNICGMNTWVTVKSGQCLQFISAGYKWENLSNQRPLPRP